MLARFDRLGQQVSLVMDTGVQFLDFGLTLALRRTQPGEFIRERQGDMETLARLVLDPASGRLLHPAEPHVRIGTPHLSLPLEESAALFDRVWLPLPLLRCTPPDRFAAGPENWARARLTCLGAEETDPAGCTHRLSLALDTRVLRAEREVRYLLPTLADVQSGQAFALAHAAPHAGRFAALPWVAQWLAETFAERAERVLHLYAQDAAAEQARLAHIGHYLNLLALFAEQAEIPQVKLIGHGKDDPEPPIPVDLVLDVGNSRTCGILFEEHPNESNRWGRRYELELRDLSEPHRICCEPFESRVELAQALFGKEHCSARSGRVDAFAWPTIARVGPEAARLAARRRGTEGATGLSSPKRYLWDEARQDGGWRFNTAQPGAGIEPSATAAPFCDLIDETGEALCDRTVDRLRKVDQGSRMPVFMPHYSRSATMMFMLAEVLTQALVQINAVRTRLRMPNGNRPRHLRTLILTVPPSMPKPERELFARRVNQAVGVVWQALGWLPPGSEDDDAALWPRPKLEVAWDEATCGQVVYLYNETVNTFGGQPKELFGVARRRPDGPERLRIATVDIGGGTTDLVINDYRLDGNGPGAYIVPVQRFRDGFKVAGDDIVLAVVRALLLPAMEEALAAAGGDAPTLLSRLIGREHLDVHQSVLRQQFSLQVMYPAALAVLRAYEDYDPVTGTEVKYPTLGELLARQGAEPPTQEVQRWLADALRDETGATAGSGFDLLGLLVRLDLDELHEQFMGDDFEITRVIRALCEVIHAFDCDCLLLTGRPSRLPGVQRVFRALLPLPPERIVLLHGYRTGGWYPFHRRGLIDDPKTTAAVGAALCACSQGGMPNFFLRAGALKPYSTVRILGVLDANMVLTDANVLYGDVDLDKANDSLKGEPIQLRGPLRLGFRQLDTERWAASPLYVLDIADRGKARDLSLCGGFLEVPLMRDNDPSNPDTDTGRFKVDKNNVKVVVPNDADPKCRISVREGDVTLRLNTLPNTALDDDSYWLDSGSIYL